MKHNTPVETPYCSICNRFGHRTIDCNRTLKDAVPSLLPCPFCKGEAKIVRCEKFCCGAKPRVIACDCGAELNGEGDELIVRWNSWSGALLDAAARMRNILIAECINKHQINPLTDSELYPNDWHLEITVTMGEVIAFAKAIKGNAERIDTITQDERSCSK